VHNEIAQRGKNKQKRSDLRQVGLAMVVSKEDQIPLFHHSYQGNLQDCTVFKEVIGKIKDRMESLGLAQKTHTLVFDRENNSKKNLAVVQELGLYYVGALTPYHHRELIDRAMDEKMTTVTLDNQSVDVYRERSMIRGDERTVLVFVSDWLRACQIRGIYQSIAKKEKSLQELRKSLKNPRGKKREKQELKEKIKDIASGQHLKGIIKWKLIEIEKEKYYLDYHFNQEQLLETEQRLGFRMIMTNRLNWASDEIITAYYGQYKVEHAFRNMKNPYHLALKPQYHWTDQKIRVHYLICVIGISWLVLSGGRQG